MKYTLVALGMLFSSAVFSQGYPHYTMFMFNKLLYNPAYAGSRNVTSVNAAYRSQWTGIDGAPRDISLTIDGPVGNSDKEFRPVALGLAINRETLGPVDNNTINASYAYRIRMEKSVLSFGLQAGVSMYSARYSDLNPYDQNDEVLANDIKNRIMPNAGAGVYWSSSRYYLGLSVPALLQNYYDKNEPTYASGKKARQTRAFYLSGGYGLPVNDYLTLLPQFMMRYVGNGTDQLPFSTDINLTAIIYKRLMIGATYRTDKSLEGIVHIQVAKKLNIGYAYDYLLSDLSPYAKGSHEITIGFDFIKDMKDFVDPRFIQNF
ncbi:PorP/SprF family type IX secretion system membrane protein [Chitinophagaceae bacterium MMS25-I14]